MRIRGFTLLELLVALTIGLAVAAASMSAVRTVIQTEESVAGARDRSWFSSANRIVCRDLDQASEIIVGRESISIETLSSADPETPGYSPLSTVTYHAIETPSGPWWVREEAPLASRTNAKPAVTLLGPDVAGLRLRILSEGKEHGWVDLHEVADRGDTRSTEGPFSAAFEMHASPDEDRVP